MTQLSVTIISFSCTKTVSSPSIPIAYVILSTDIVCERSSRRICLLHFANLIDEVNNFPPTVTELVEVRAGEKKIVFLPSD